MSAPAAPGSLPMPEPPPPLPDGVAVPSLHLDLARARAMKGSSSTTSHVPAQAALPEAGGSAQPSRPSCTLPAAPLGWRPAPLVIPGDGGSLGGGACSSGRGVACEAFLPPSSPIKLSSLLTTLDLDELGIPGMLEIGERPAGEQTDLHDICNEPLGLQAFSDAIRRAMSSPANFTENSPLLKAVAAAADLASPSGNSPSALANAITQLPVQL